MRSLHSALVGSILLLASTAFAQQLVHLPLGEGANGVGGLKAVSLPGVTAKVSATDAGLLVAFDKRGEGRRLLALEAPVRRSPVGARALAVTCRLQQTEGDSPRLALVAYEKDGGAWYKLSPRMFSADEPSEVCLPLGSFRRAAFAQDADADLDWEQVEKVWLGLAFDGPAGGTWEIGKVLFTSEPYRPSQPLRLTGDGPGTWSVGKDPAVKATLTTPSEGPGGKPCMKVEFTFPGGRHMYLTPSTPLPDAEVDGYKALQFTYKAALPEGLRGLLVMLRERNGAQWLVDPLPPATEDWKTLTCPFSGLKLGSWSKDPNGTLDLEDVDAVLIGTHGVAKQGGEGTIIAADVQFVP